MFSQSVTKGFFSVNEVMLLSLLVGLSGLAGQDLTRQIAKKFFTSVNDGHSNA